jgi:RNA polymerase sigma-70 factor (ECF subfamily)
MRWWFIAIVAAVFGQRTFPAAELSDDDLIQGISRRDGDAFARLYDRHARAVFSLAFRILGDQAGAEDVVEEVFAQAWRQAERYQPHRGQLGAWLLNMTRSRAIDGLRRGRRTAVAGEGLLRDLPSEAPAVEAIAIVGDQVRALRDALARLPAAQRVAIELAYYEGLSHAEIAHQLEEPLGTVKTRVRLGLLKLREAMSGDR